MTKKPLNRRRLLVLGLGGAAGMISSQSHGGITPAQTEGPFYPIRPQDDKDTDLSRIKGHSQSAKGRVIKITGRVVDSRNQPLSGVLVDIWQANTWGRYAHERDPNPAPLDPNFQGWGQFVTARDGVYAFTTIYPGAYPANRSWKRPPHIHFKVKRQGYRNLTTQMYFPGEALNQKDLILKSLSSTDQESVIAKAQGPAGFQFDIVLAKL